MNYMIEKMTEVELLQMLVAIENKRNTGFVDITKANQRLEEYDASKRKEKLSQMLLQSQSDFSREELLQYMLQQEQGNTSKNNGIKIVQVSTEQQQTINRNLKLRDEILYDEKLKALVDKYNNKE